MSTNIAVIKSIEFKPRNSCCCRGVVDFRNGSAEYEAKTSRQSAGNLTRHTLTFRLTPISESNNQLLYEMTQSRAITFWDVNGMEMTLGNEYLPPKIDVEELIEGKFGSFRGYKVTVTWDDQGHIRPLRTCTEIRTIYRGETLYYRGCMEFNPEDSIQSLTEVDLTIGLGTGCDAIVVASSDPAQHAPLTVTIEDDHHYYFEIPADITSKFEPGMLTLCLQLTVKSSGVVLITQYNAVEVKKSVFL